MRASHADREQVIGTLKAAFVQGRLDKGEFDLRVGQTFASRTYADLAAVTADLPAGLAETLPPKRVPARGGRPGRIVAIATLLYAVGWVCALVIPEHGENSAALAMAYLGTVAYLCVLVVVAAAALEVRHERRSAARPRHGPGSGAGGAAFRRPPAAGRRPHYPGAAPGHWHGAIPVSG
jgi:Domain of unknown function (DUF1707)